MNVSATEQPVAICSVCSCQYPAGNHYGAVTCHACKSFFKRTVQFSLSYSCLRRQRHCSLLSERNRACGACRFRRCLEVGMRTGLVRSLAPDTSQQAGASLAGPRQSCQLTPPSAEREGDDDGSGGRRHQDHSAAAAAAPPPPPDLEPVRIDLSSLPAGLGITAMVSGGIWLLVESFLGKLISWAKRLPDFASLAIQDQMALLQRHWLDIIVLQVAWNSHPYSGVLNFCQGFSLHERQEGLIRQVPRVSKLTRCLAQRIGHLNLSHAELLHLRPIFFLETSCHADWAEQDRIDSIQRRHLLALIRLCRCPIRRAHLLQLGAQLTAGRLLALCYFNRALNLEGQLPPPLTEELLRASLQLGEETRL